MLTEPRINTNFEKADSHKFAGLNWENEKGIGTDLKLRF
jgi:hypothetical protein